MDFSGLCTILAIPEGFVTSLVHAFNVVICNNELYCLCFISCFSFTFFSVNKPVDNKKQKPKNCFIWPLKTKNNQNSLVYIMFPNEVHIIA